ncbi:hypothetical protein Esti_001224 [Eimeria stiedai]
MDDGVVEFTSSGMTHSLGDMWLVRHVLLPLQRYLYTPKLRWQPVEILVSSRAAETGEVLLEETLRSDSISWQNLRQSTPNVPLSGPQESSSSSNSSSSSSSSSSSEELAAATNEATSSFPSLPPLKSRLPT